MKIILHFKDDLQVDQKLEKIWTDHFNNNEANPIAPLYQEQIHKNVITFLSLNPSLRPNNEAVSNYSPQTFPLVDYKKDKKDEKIPFFHKFYELGKILNQPWTMLDLLYERDSTQANLEKKYNPKTINTKDKIFLQHQIKLTFEILDALNPKAIVVSNRWTEKLIHSNLKDLGLSQELPSEGNSF